MRCLPVILFISVKLFAGGGFLQNHDPKQAIELYQSQLKEAPVEKQPEIKKELAKAYLADQNQEQAIVIFLESVEQLKNSAKTEAANDELQLYDKAIKIYLDSSANNPLENSRRLLEQFGKLSDDHPDYYLLGFIIAAADANIGRYASFFDRFFKSYSHYPDHYLAYKTKAILHIKLFEKARTVEAKNKERQKIYEFLERAIAKEPSDITLYKAEITFAPDADKKKRVQESLNRIISQNMIVPRSDIQFFVMNAVDIKDYELAQKFIDRAKGWYRTSRVIDSAQEYLDNRRK